MLFFNIYAKYWKDWIGIGFPCQRLNIAFSLHITSVCPKFDFLQNGTQRKSKDLVDTWLVLAWRKWIQEAVVLCRLWLRKISNQDSQVYLSAQQSFSIAERHDAPTQPTAGSPDRCALASTLARCRLNHQHNWLRTNEHVALEIFDATSSNNMPLLWDIKVTATHNYQT